MKIGTVEINNRFVLAPLAGVSCTAFRLLCKENGAGLVYTQMIDADLIAGKKPDEVECFLNIVPQERPVSVQLIGSNKKNLIRAVRNVEPFADIIDLNVGCIEEDYLAKNCGAALLRNLDHLWDVIQAMVSATTKPVTVKIRIGWDNQHIIGVKVAELLERHGVQALCVHGRTADQKYAGKVNWTIMKQIKQKTSIPIIANGDVKSYGDGLEMLEKTGCDFVMIGREAMHCPWVFNMKKVDVKKQILRFIELYQKYEKRQSVVEIGDHVFWMLRDVKTTEDTRKVHLLSTVGQIERFVARLGLQEE